jgi:hypothetical protein
MFVLFLKTSMDKAMENSKQNIKETGKKEDKKNAASDDSSETQKPVDDSFKTSPRKYRLSWETPLDEQMHDSNRLSQEDED